ncbi:neuronal pentraxin-2-like isoform X2 [Clavelina lepadiformis]|uniref:Pentraxin (PTX) domain-containing protein n=1 Tax=Clavelina lepadiformis TaxID=159417 RepID=A0ABP0GG74_CLALP
MNVLVVLLWLTFLFTGSYGQFQNQHSQQVPVCASIPVGVPVNGPETFQGPKGEHGTAGKRGPKGERGSPGHPWGHGGCPTITYHFPRDDQIADYVWYRSYVPRMIEATACAWLETSDFHDDIASWVSYAIPGQNNEFLLSIRTKTTADIYIGGQSHKLLLPDLSSMNKFHACVWFSNKTRQTGIYINSERVSTLPLKGFVSQGGGSMIFGQDQDDVNAGSLAENQAYNGNITNLMIWPRVLSQNEINNLAYNCQCPVDYVIALTLDRVELFGEAHYSIPDTCPTL